MGWSSGSELMQDVITNFNATNIQCTSLEKVKFYKELIKNFKAYDCDTLDECLNMDADFDIAYYELHPDCKD